MPYLGKTADSDQPWPSEVLTGLGFARGAVEFAALGLVAGQNQCLKPQLHLFAVAIELAFKSIALLAGANLDDCKDVGHNISKMIALIEDHGVTVPERLKNRLGKDDKWFKEFFQLTRYTELAPPRSWDKIITFHDDYPEMIAAILEIPGYHPLQFVGGNALAEITNRFNPTSAHTEHNSNKDIS